MPGEKNPLWLSIRRSPPIWSRQDIELLAQIKAQESSDSECFGLLIAT